MALILKKVTLLKLGLEDADLANTEKRLTFINSFIDIVGYLLNKQDLKMLDNSNVLANIYETLL